MCAPNALRHQDHPGQLWIFKCHSQDILEVFSFPLSNLGREPQAAFFQMTLMRLDRVFLLDRCYLQMPPREEMAPVHKDGLPKTKGIIRLSLESDMLE